jgi:tetratricopeptide (TPR) repeat protein
MKKTLEGLLNQAERQRNAGECHEALNTFLKAAEFAKQLEDFPSVAHALYRAGVTAKLFVRRKSDSKYRDALSYLRAARDLFEELGEMEEVGKIYRDIAVTHDYAKQKAAALENFARAVEILQKGGWDGELALTYDKLGLHFYIYNDLETAQRYLDKSFEFFQKAPRGFYQAISWQDYAKLLCKQGRYTAAIDWAEQSLSWYQADHDGVVYQRKIAQLYGMLSVLYHLDGREKMAKKFAVNYERLLKSFDGEVAEVLRQELSNLFNHEVQDPGN